MNWMANIKAIYLEETISYSGNVRQLCYTFETERFHNLIFCMFNSQTLHWRYSVLRIFCSELLLFRNTLIKNVFCHTFNGNIFILLIPVVVRIEWNMYILLYTCIYSIFCCAEYSVPFSVDRLIILFTLERIEFYFNSICIKNSDFRRLYA